jgi:hypothetical protein
MKRDTYTKVSRTGTRTRQATDSKGHGVDRGRAGQVRITTGEGLNRQESQQAKNWAGDARLGRRRTRQDKGLGRRGTGQATDLTGKEGDRPQTRQASDSTGEGTSHARYSTGDELDRRRTRQATNWTDDRLNKLRGGQATDEKGQGQDRAGTRRDMNSSGQGLVGLGTRWALETRRTRYSLS